MLSSDVLHEVELGVWKSLFIHLIRLLEALTRRGVNDLDYRCVSALFSCQPAIVVLILLNDKLSASSNVWKGYYSQI